MDDKIKTGREKRGEKLTLFGSKEVKSGPAITNSRNKYTFFTLLSIPAAKQSYRKKQKIPKIDVLLK